MLFALQEMFALSVGVRRLQLSTYLNVLSPQRSCHSGGTVSRQNSGEWVARPRSHFSIFSRKFGMVHSNLRRQIASSPGSYPDYFF